MVLYGRLTDRMYRMKGGWEAGGWADPPLHVLTTEEGQRWVNRAKNFAGFFPDHRISATVNVVADELTFFAKDQETPQQKAQRLIKEDPKFADEIARHFLGMQEAADEDLDIKGMAQWLQESDELLRSNGLPTRNATDRELRESASQSTLLIRRCL